MHAGSRMRAEGLYSSPPEELASASHSLCYTAVAVKRALTHKFSQQCYETVPAILIVAQ